MQRRDSGPGRTINRESMGFNIGLRQLRYEWIALI